MTNVDLNMRSKLTIKAPEWERHIRHIVTVIYLFKGNNKNTTEKAWNLFKINKDTTATSIALF